MQPNLILKKLVDRYVANRGGGDFQQFISTITPQRGDELEQLWQVAIDTVYPPPPPERVSKPRKAP